MADLLDQRCALGVVEVEQVAACVASDVAHTNRLAFREGTDELLKILLRVLGDADFGKVGLELLTREHRGVCGVEADLEHLVDEAVLGLVEFLHQLGGDVGRQLQGEVALLTVLSDFFNRLDREVKELVECCVLSIADALHHVAADAADAALLELPSVAVQVGHSDTAGEHGGGCALDYEVRKAGAEDFVGGVDSHKTVIDEKVAAHHLVNYKFLAKSERAVSREHALLSVLGIACHLSDLLSDTVSDVLEGISLGRCGRVWGGRTTRAFAATVPGR